MAELLVKIRLVHFLGVLLEPIMRPLFRLPGCSSLVVVMGFTSGFPVGAVLTRKLYEQDMLSSEEAERLFSFTNNASPLFILGAVGVGMLGNPAAGYLLALAHYISNLMVGFLWRFRGKPGPDKGMPLGLRFSQAYRSLTPDSPAPPESIGKMLGDAVRSSLGNVMAVGGFIVVFSVVTRMLSNGGVIDLMAASVMRLLGTFGLGYPQAYGLCMGIMEMTLGIKTAVSSITEHQMLAVLIVISAILAFSGLSIIAQIMSIMAGMPVRLSFYILSRLIQVVLSCLITVLAYKIALIHGIGSLGVNSIPYYKILYAFNAWTFSLISIGVAGIILALMLLAAALRTSKSS
nr:hypothetical protein [Syntrophomonas zehnderi]